MTHDRRGVRFVLTAPDTESTEQAFSPWKQMVYASVPARFAPRLVYKRHLQQETNPDGTAAIMPYGLRIIEAILLEDYPPEDVAVCYPDSLHLFVGPRTRAVGISAHNPVGLSFSTGVYANIFGSSERPINAAESERVFLHPVLRKYRPRIIVGGAGAWQIEKTNSFKRLHVDCVVVGRCEAVILDLFRRADEGEKLPSVVRAPEPTPEQMRFPLKRSTYGISEMTRGCGRQCAFCSPTLETRISIPPERLIESAKANVRAGGRMVFPISEDIFIYGASAPFYIPNGDALVSLYENLARIPGLDHVQVSHATIAPALVDRRLIKELSRILLPKAVLRNPASTYPNKAFVSALIGLETGSARLAAQTMAGKALPFDIQDWQEIVVEGLSILNEHNWFPVCTYIIGLPDETDEDVRQSLGLLHRLRRHKIIHAPSIFTPLEHTPMANGPVIKPRQLTKLQWEFMLTAWRQSIDFGVVDRGTNRLWKWGAYAFYYGRGRWLHGTQFKYPLFRFAGMSEERLAPHLYLNWTERGTTPDPPVRTPRLIQKHALTTVPNLVQVQKRQPFSVYGKAHAANPAVLFQNSDHKVGV
jgi:radical SAM superfamily enzyme YgiQ (UPF0313 family)